MGLFKHTPKQTMPDPTQSAPDTRAEELKVRLEHQREMAAQHTQQKVERHAERARRRQERRAIWRALGQRAESWWQARQAPKATPALSPLERHRARIESFDEDREGFAEKIVRYLFLGLAYVLPFLVALSVGKEIGDAYSGTADYWADGWSIGTHTVAYAGEFALAMMVLSTATAFKRSKADRSYTSSMLGSLFFFALFIAASSLAQWFIAEQHIHPKNTADLAALIFRVTMPPAVDIASMLYLGIMGYKSLKKFLAEQNLKAEAIRLLNEAELKIVEAQQEAERRQKETEQTLALKERRELLLLRIEEIHSQAMIDTAQHALLPGKLAPYRIEEESEDATNGKAPFRR